MVLSETLKQAYAVHSTVTPVQQPLKSTKNQCVIIQEKEAEKVSKAQSKVNHFNLISD